MTSCHDRQIERVRSAVRRRVPVHAARQRWPAARIREFQQECLRKLLAYAAEHSPFHSRRLRGIDAKRFPLEALGTLPVMTKADLVQSFDEIVTNPRLSYAGVAEHLEHVGQVPLPLETGHFAARSGGSSGLRAVFVYDEDAVADLTARYVAGTGSMPAASGMLARLRRLTRKRGPAVTFVGSRTATHLMRLISSFIPTDHYRSSHAPATQPFPEIVATLNAMQPKVLITYPAILHRLTYEQEEGRLSIRPAMLRSGGSNLDARTAARVESVFGAPLLDTFGASEGAIGRRMADEAGFTFASDLVILELVDENCRPVAAGVQSDKVLLTNLYNKAQPLIRLELDDRMTRRPDSPDHGHLRASVEGKSLVVFTYGDRRLFPLTTCAPAIMSSSVADYQVRQTATGVELDLIVTGPFDKDEATREIEGKMRAAGIRLPLVTIRIVEALDSDPVTGKVQRFVSCRRTQLR